jgi:hypothetical protein
MKMKQTRAMQSVNMGRDVRYVDKKLRELAKSHTEEVLDINQFRYEVQRWIERIDPQRINDALYQDIDKLVDSYISEFLRRNRDRHHAELGELGALKRKIMPYLGHADVLLVDQKNRIGYLDGAVTHAMDRLTDGESPLVDPRHRATPPKEELQ